MLATGGEDGGLKVWNLHQMNQSKLDKDQNLDKEVFELKTRVPLPNSSQIPQLQTN